MRLFSTYNQNTGQWEVQEFRDISEIQDGEEINSFGEVETELGNKADNSQTIDSTTKLMELRI